MNQDDRIIFTQICHLTSISNNPTIDTDDLLMEVIKWAERHNYAPLRLSQASKRAVQNFCYTLSKLHFCHMKRDENEVITITLTEPQFEFVDLAYKHMMHEPEAPFPTEQLLPLPLQPGKTIDVFYEDISSKLIEENFNKDKMIKILFPEMNAHILINPKLMVQLPTLCLKKMGKYFIPSTRNRILDQILKPIEVIMPEKNLKVERVLKVLNLEEKETPMFYIHLTEGIIARLKKESDVEEILPILQSAYILKQFKLEQDEKDKDDRKEAQALEDIGRILNIFKSNPKSYYQAELYRFREGEGHKEQFAGKYDKNQFSELIEKFLQKYTISNKNGETPAEIVPEIITLTDPSGRDMYIHRLYLVSLIERDRTHAKADFRKYLLERMIFALENYIELPEMKNDASLDEEALKFIDKSYAMLKYILSDTEVFYNIFKIYEEDREIASKQSCYFYKDKNVLLPLRIILEVNKTELFKEAYAQLPFLYRFFLSRLILFLISMFKKDSRQGSVKKSSDKKEQTSASTAEIDIEKTSPESPDEIAESVEDRKIVQANLRKILPELEKKYRSSQDNQTQLNELHEKWNIKVGEVRGILREKIDRDIMNRSTAIYRMLLRSPNFTAEYLHKELRNMAIDLAQNKYTEIHDKKSLARYIMVLSLWTLRLKNK